MPVTSTGMTVGFGLSNSRLHGLPSFLLSAACSVVAVLVPAIHVAVCGLLLRLLRNVPAWMPVTNTGMTVGFGVSNSRLHGLPSFLLSAARSAVAVLVTAIHVAVCGLLLRVLRNVPAWMPVTSTGMTVGFGVSNSRLHGLPSLLLNAACSVVAVLVTAIHVAVCGLLLRVLRNVPAWMPVTNTGMTVGFGLSNSRLHGLPSFLLSAACSVVAVLVPAIHVAVCGLLLRVLRNVPAWMPVTNTGMTVGFGVSNSRLHGLPSFLLRAACSVVAVLVTAIHVAVCGLLLRVLRNVPAWMPVTSTGMTVGFGVSDSRLHGLPSFLLSAARSVVAVLVTAIHVAVCGLLLRVLRNVPA